MSVLTNIKGMPPKNVCQSYRLEETPSTELV